MNKTNNFANNELSKSEKPPNRQSGGFWAVLGGFWAVFGLFTWLFSYLSQFGEFSSPKTNYFANYEFSKSEKPPNRQFVRFWEVLGGFGWFLGSFGGYLAIFLNLVSFIHQN